MFSCHVVIFCDFRLASVLRPLAAFAGLDDHVGELLDLGGFADVVEYGERLQILGHTARRCRRLWVYGVI